MMITNKIEAPVVYMCACVAQGILYAQDNRTYKRLGDAKKRLLRLNATHDAPSQVALAAQVMAKGTDEVLADDILDGAARWYAFKGTDHYLRLLQAKGMK